MMNGEKNTYYIEIGSGEISRSKTSSTWNYKIQATDEEITKLRQIFDDNYTTEWVNFFRAHVPFLEYHHDQSNDEYDANMKKVYAMIYQLGDEEAREHIRSTGIIRIID